MDETVSAAPTERRWRPLPARERRVLGVLVEKAKTTPDIYPLSVNALRAGCNQKNNRFPLMELEEADVEESLDALKQTGAVAEVQGSSRVARYKHYLYDWLGVDKVELSVMAELLLRGAQTEGELRGRASRMDPLPDLPALRAVLDSLQSKGLVLSLTPAGRGHVVTHALYEDRELARLRSEYGAGEGTPAEAAAPRVESAAAAPPPAHALARDDELAALRRDVDALRSDVARLRHDLEDLWSNFR
jgi:hypothetical protein